MVQHVLSAKRPPTALFLLLFILVASVTSTKAEVTEERSARSLFSSLFGAVVSSFGRHVVKRQRKLEAENLASARIEAVDSIQNKQNFTLFGSVFTKVDEADLEVISTTTSSTTEITNLNQSYPNQTALDAKPKGVFDDIANGITSLFGGAGPAVDSGPEAVNLVPNNCWYRGEKYECALSLTCAMQGQKSLDLCNGGLIWTCCVDRDKIDKIDPELGALSDAKCGEIYTGETARGNLQKHHHLYDDRQSRIVGGSSTFFGQHPWQVCMYS